MSYPNFSYYNGPTAQKNFWTPLESPAYESMAKANSVSHWPLPTFVPVSTNNNQNVPHISVYNPPVAEVTVPRHQVLQGNVTQMFSNFGYIDDEIIFSVSDVMGPMVKVGDKVAVDATFQPNNPTKYKGERVVKIDESKFSSSGNTAYGNTKALTQESTRIDLTSSMDSYIVESNNHIGKSIKDRLSNKYENYESNSRKQQPKINKFNYQSERSGQTNNELKADEIRKEKSTPIKNKLNDGNKRLQHNVITLTKSTPLKRMANNSEVHNHKILSPPKNMKATISPSKSKNEIISSINNKFDNKKQIISPIKLKSESKECFVSKNYENFASRELDSALVRLQCQSLKIPHEFFHVSLKYQQTFPLNHPIKLGNKCHFKILDKQIKSIDSSVEDQLNNNVDPQDANYSFVAKVMLLSCNGLAQFYKDTLKTGDEVNNTNKIPITKAINFLVGSIGENKEFAIGGAWSPLLDGLNPESDPKVLINTAIRTCKSITGIDLSSCSSWPKFLELHYYRPPQKDKNEIIIDLDDIMGESKNMEPRMETVVYFIPNVWSCMPDQDNWDIIYKLYQEQFSVAIFAQSSATDLMNVKNDYNSILKPQPSSDESKRITDNYMDDERQALNVIQNIEASQHEIQPTHFSKLIINSMKIVNIKKELELRKLNNRGVMEQLKARLKCAIEREENEEKNKGDSTSSTTLLVIKKILDDKLSENEKIELKKLYNFPDLPHIIVHQNKKLFNNQMKVRTMSLHSLLSYYDAPLQESTFELALFAKQFFEMMRRDATFNIYKSIVVAQDSDLISRKLQNKTTVMNTTKRTMNLPLLFSCTLLDCEGTNLISLEHLKVLIEGLGIFLSSNQLNKVIRKIQDTSNNFNYRLLTDKEISSIDAMKLDVSDDYDYIRELALGNKALFEGETLSTDTRDIERLMNELDKSERCRQSFELKMSEMKSETQKSISAAQLQAKEMVILNDQLLEYKTKYQNEQSQCNEYKQNLQNLLRRLKDIDSVTRGLSINVSKSLEDYMINTTKKKSSEQSPSSDSNAVLDCHVQKFIIKPIVFDLTDESSKSITKLKNVEVCETHDTSVDLSLENVSMEVCETNDTNAAILEDDFDLLKPSDYDTIILEDTE